MPKKTTKTTPAPKSLLLTPAELCELTPGTRIELLIRVKFADACAADPDDPSQACEFEDLDGDCFFVPFGNIVEARIVPRGAVKLSGPGAEAAAEILRAEGFDV